MEAMLVLMTKLQEAGYTEETRFYSATLTSPDKDIRVIIDATSGVHDVTLVKGTDKSSKTLKFADIRTTEDAEEILSYIIF